MPAHVVPQCSVFGLFITTLQNASLLRSGHKKSKNTCVSLSLAAWRCRCFEKLLLCCFFSSPLPKQNGKLSKQGKKYCQPSFCPVQMMHLVTFNVRYKKNLMFNCQPYPCRPHHLPFMLSPAFMVVLLSLIQDAGCSLWDWSVYFSWNESYFRLRI